MRRILFVAMSHSIHTARWISQIVGQPWDIHLFPAQDADIHPYLKNLTIHDAIIRPPGLDSRLRFAGAWPWPFRWGGARADSFLKRIRRSSRLKALVADRSWRLSRLIRWLKPDIVHSLEMTIAGYLTLEARIHFGGGFPAWIVSNWGSDIYLFGRLPEHVGKIKAVLSTCDYYACECQRDVDLGRDFGFKGEVLPVLPNTGGFDLERVRQFRQKGPPSARRIIAMKGYQSWSGRALVGLRALELCADVLKGYRVAIYSACPDVKLVAALLSHSKGIPIDIIPPCSHEDILRLHGQARVSIGLSISDGISTSFLEAMVMGSFPIQSHTSCASEWVRDGETGFLVPPEDPQEVAAAIRHAVTDDALVDGAAEKNARLVQGRLHTRVIQPQVVKAYEQVAERVSFSGKG